MKSMAWLVLSLSALAYAGSADAHRRAPIADGHSGHRIENAWDRRGDRIDRRLDRAAFRQDALGHHRRANHLDRRGDRIDRRLDWTGIRRQALHDGRR
ncbi:MAG: hypothetical protein NT117_07990 [Gammaproteobacteria bacterium]|nr:hypothetical protein [Gammaproteobacteria bacterium]